MFYMKTDRMFQQGPEGSEGAQVPLHHTDDNGERPHQPEETNPSGDDVNGTWGERDVGGPVNLRHAMQDYEEMRKELSNLSRTRSRKSAKSQARQASILNRQISRASQGAAAKPEQDLEAQEHAKEEVETPMRDSGSSEEEEFELGGFLKNGHFEKRKDGESAKKVGVVYKNLTVQGVGATTTFVKTLPNSIIGVSGSFASRKQGHAADTIQTFGPDFYKLLARLIPVLPQPGSAGVKRDLIHDFSGVVRDGEMLLVLGRPGSGCSTFLKAVSNKRESFAGVTGEVAYGGISAEEQKKNYKGEVNYNEEDDQHFPSLTVQQTLEFSLLNKTRKHEKGDIPVIISALLKMFGISHTRHTLVGDVSATLLSLLCER